MSRKLFCLAAAVLLVSSGAAIAGERLGYRDAGYGPGFVTADSRYGGATISAPIRRAVNGLEVRLPGGSWVDCHRNCSETLRRETIDFWQNHSSSRDGQSDGPGYFLWRR